MKSTVVFGGVYVLGLFAVPTLVPYVAAVLIVLHDAFRELYRPRIDAQQHQPRADRDDSRDVDVG